MREDDVCGSCAEGLADHCSESERPCGHHCNHSWSHDQCCWCRIRWGEGGRTYRPGEPGYDYGEKEPHHAMPISKRVCPWCQGTGSYPSPGNRCSVCGGTGKVK